MVRALACTAVAAVLLALPGAGRAGISERVVELPTRPGVTQRFLLIQPDAPAAVVILLPGGDGDVALTADGHFKNEASSGGNFLVRARKRFVHRKLLVAIVDAPSDRLSPPFLSGGFRMRPEHMADVRAVIAWLRQEVNLPIWLVGTSTGSLSAAVAASRLGPKDGPDGVVLTSAVVTTKPRDKGLLDLPGLRKIDVPTLVVHHRRDGCDRSRPEDLPRLMEALTSAPRKELILVEGGVSKGDPCHPQAHHGFNAIENKVVDQIAGWILETGA